MEPVTRVSTEKRQRRESRPRWSEGEEVGVREVGEERERRGRVREKKTAQPCAKRAGPILDGGQVKP